MKHVMSDAELRRAIREITDRADSARKRGDLAMADGLDRTVREYQDAMSHRL
ncbi:hypothetical protein ABH922_000728 [Rhodococcus sp. 27YEA15]|uniref:hypothetical protein n=1 Tax=Rhodococcus sp. 27YEA15 TaxID=3156259 RepID=UPI003C79B946